MDLFLDPDDHRSLSWQLYEQLRDAIVDGRLPPGARLQPTRVAAGELDVARSTVTGAYTRLTAEGYVEGRRGGGSIVLGSVLPAGTADPVSTALTPVPQAAAVRRYGSDLAVRDRYDLSAGRVDPRLFPLADWRRCAARALTGLAGDLGHYGEPAGSPEVRQAIAQWAAQSRGVAAGPDHIMVTSGSTHALDLVARVLLRPGDVAAVEEPGYPPVSTLLRSLGADVVGVPVDRDGLIVDALPAHARLVHVTPSHQYPLGVVLSRERRLALLRWAGRHNAAIVEDDYDSQFRYTARPLEPLHRLDRDGRVVYVGTFSKILSPALRLAFAIVPPGLVPALTAVRQAIDVGPSPLATSALALFINRGHLARHVRRAHRVYAARHRAVWSALTRLAGPGMTPLPTQAGLHLTLLTPGAPDDDVLVARAARRRLLLSTLRLTYRCGEAQPGIVLGFGAIATPDVPRAVTLLTECLSGA